MTQPSDMQAQLRSLSIPKEQRPQAPARQRGKVLGKSIIAAVLLATIFGAYKYGPLIVSTIKAAANSTPTKNDESGIRTLTVTLTSEPDAAPVLTATGKIVSDHRVAVATKVSGQITELFFEQGDRVKERQTLAKIEDILYRARRDEAAARLQRTLANLQFQKVNFNRVKGLLETESAPSIEYADAKRAIDEAQAQVNADRAALAWSEKMVTDCEVTAPIAGVILQRNVEVGDFVAAEGGRGANANAQFGIIADMTKLRVEVDISELDIVRLRRDMPCTVTPDAYKDRRYPGFVMWIDPGANYSKATVQVKVRIENPDEFLRVEGSAQVAFFAASPKSESAQTSTAIWIPTSAAILEPGGQSAKVFIVSNGRAQLTVVKIVRRSGEQLEVASGLSVGQTMVAEKIDRISEGQKIPQ